MNINDKKWVTKYGDKGEFLWTAPYKEYLAMKYYSKVSSHIRDIRLFWGTRSTSEEIWKIAQKEYENFKEELPAFYLAQHLPCKP